MEKKATTGRILLLIIVFIAIWFLVIAKFESEKEELDKILISSQGIDNGSKSTTSKITQKRTTTSVSTNTKQIVTDKQVFDLDKEGPLVIKINGKYYEVKEGSFIIDSNVVIVDEDEKSVQFLNTPRRTVSSN